MVELQSTKLYFPPPRPNLVPRPRLIQLLQKGLVQNDLPRFLAYWRRPSDGCTSELVRRITR